MVPRRRVHWWDGWTKEKDSEEEARFVSFSTLDAVVATIEKEMEENKEAKNREDCFNKEIMTLKREILMLREQISCMEKEKEKVVKEWEFSEKKRNEELKMELVELNTILTELGIEEEKCETEESIRDGAAGIEGKAIERIGPSDGPMFFEVAKYNGGGEKPCDINGNDRIVATEEDGEVTFYMEALHKKHIDLGISSDPLTGDYGMDFMLKEEIVFSFEVEDVMLLSVISSDLFWRRLIRSVCEQNFAKLKSSMGLIAM